MRISKSLLLTATTALLTLTCDKVPDFCGGGELYDPSCAFCYGSQPYRLCTNEKKTYNPLVQGCTPTTDVVGTRCSDGSVVSAGTPCGGYTLTVAATPADAGNVTYTPPADTAGRTYRADETVVLNAAPNDRNEYEFLDWAGAQPTDGSRVSGSMLGAKYAMRNNGGSPQVTIVAMFKPKSAGKLIVDAFPQGVGDVTRSPDKEIYEEDDIVTVTANERPGSGYTFSGWSGADTSRTNPSHIAMNESKTLVAIFTPTVHTLSAVVSPADGGAVYINNAAMLGGEFRDVGTEVTVWARAEAGYAFSQWTGSGATFADSRNPNTTVRLEANATITAHFTVGGGSPVAPPLTSTTYTLAVTSSPANGGSVSLNPDGKEYNAGISVTATATPHTGYTFTGWSGAATGGNATVAITMNGNKTLTANFTSSGSGGGGFATSFVNPATGRDYSTAVIGNQTWMAENLNYETSSGSWCYDNKPDSCKKYGRLYDWSAAMNISSSNNSNTWGGSDVKHQGVCPAGWHLPSRAEWNQLESDVGSPAGTKLKSTSGWYNNGNGTDEFGFSALPGGYRNYSDGSFNAAGYCGYWWTATEIYSGYAYYRYMSYYNVNLYEDGNYEESGFAVRCVGDN